MRSRLIIAGATVLLLCSCVPVPLHDLIVQRVAEGTIVYVDAAAPLKGNGKSWSTAYRYLADALLEAAGFRDAYGASPTIDVAEGIYYPGEHESPSAGGRDFSAASHMKLYGGFPPGGGTRDPRAHVTVLSGDIGRDDYTGANGVTENPGDIVGDNADSVLSFVAKRDQFTPDIGEDTVVDGFTICGADTTAAVLNAENGGICNPTLRNLVLEGNALGALSVSAGNASESSPRLQHVTIRRNSSGMSVGSSGGTSSLILIDVSFVENAGCGLSAGTAGGAVTMTVINALFEGNLGPGASFSAYTGGSTRITIANSVFVGNATPGSGGGIDASGNSTGSALDLSLVNVTFSQNQAKESGGAVYTCYCSPRCDNCIFWNDTASGGGNEFYVQAGTNSVPVFTASDVQGSGGSASWNAALGTDGKGNIDQDPLFTLYPNPGDGKWSTFGDNNYGSLVLSASSPAREAGHSALLPADTFDLDGDGSTTEHIPYDCCGNSREQGSSVDMGAYESP